jgi:hypothetical protein
VTPRLWLVSALVVLAGCGGASDEDQVKDVAGQYAQAFADRDYASACAVTTAPGPSCEDALRTLREAAGSDIKSTVKSVSVNGDRATAAFAGEPFPVPLEKRDGKWLVTIAER